MWPPSPKLMIAVASAIAVAGVVLQVWLTVAAMAILIVAQLIRLRLGDRGRPVSKDPDDHR